MEEFKNLKEIIELCNEELENNDENVNATLDFEDLKELQNLINKYKEQEKMIDGYEKGEIFSNKQLELIQNAIKEEMENTYKKELDKNYIPKILLEEELKVLIQEKEKRLKDRTKSIFLDGAIFAVEDLLNFEKAKGEQYV